MKSVVTKVLLAFTVVLLVTLAVGCKANAPEAAVAGPAATADQEYAYVIFVSSLPVWNYTKSGFQFAADKLGVKATFVGPVDADAQAQTRMIEELIAKKVAGIAICPVSADVQQAPLKKAMDAGIPVVTFISDVNGGRATHYGFIAADGLSIGRTGATYAAEKLMDKEGKVAILTMPGSEVHDRRRKGYENTFANYPKIKVVTVADTKADPNIGLQKAAEIIQAHPDLKVLIATDSTGGAAAARAVKEAGKVGKIKIIAMDRDDDLLNYIKEGVVTATLTDQHYTIGFLAMNYLYWIKNQYIKDVPDFSQVDLNPLPWFTEVNVAVVTQDNVDQFYSEKFAAQFK